MARLLDIATVNPDDGREWRLGYDATARECNVQVEFAEACDPTYIAIVGDETTFGIGSYKVIPFPVQGFLRLGVNCHENDDAAWLAASFRALAERVVTRALVIQAAAGNEAWLGDDSVQTQTLSDATDAVLDAGIAAARETWFSTVVDPIGRPIMHVPPSMVSRLVRLGWLVKLGSENEAESTLGDPVVIGNGYEADPHVFFTGSIVVRLTEPNIDDGVLINARMNNLTIPIDRLGCIDVAPCSIVKVGA